MALPAAQEVSTAAPVAAQQFSTATLPDYIPTLPPPNWFYLAAGPLSPFLFAYDMDDRALPEYPFDPINDSLSGVSWSWEARGSWQLFQGQRPAEHADLFARQQERYGGDLHASVFARGAFSPEKASYLGSLHATADLSHGDAGFLEYGLGVADLQGRHARLGPSFEARGRLLLARPWVAEACWQEDLMGKFQFFHDFSVGIGPSWKRLTLEAGYRAFLNPLRNVYGPQLSLRWWL